MKGKRVLAVALGTIISLSACASLPTSGPVTPFELKENDSASLVLKGFGPVQDASPDTIVRDFLRASAAGWSDDFQVARSYLLEEAQKTWRPDTATYVYSDDTPPLIGVTGPDKIQVDTRIVASLSKDGRYSLEKSNVVYQTQFVLAQDAQNQWRIRSLPDGAVISESSFRATFQNAAVFFPAADKRTLVADRRWFPRRRIASYLMQSILTGPSEEIAPAVINAAPEGAILPLQNVEVQDSVAEVAIEGSGLGTEEAQRLFRWQVVATLLQVSNVSEVHVSINGVRLGDEPLPTGPAWALDTLVSVAKDGIASERDGKREVLVPAAVLKDVQITAPTRGPLEDSQLAFVQGGNKLMAVGRAAQPIQIYEGANLSSPSVDRVNWTWTVTGSKIVVARAGTDPIIFDSPFGAQYPITSVRVSPDGSRLLVLRGGDSPSAGILPIRRSTEGRPTELGALTPLGDAEARVLDGTWLGNGEIALLQVEGGSRFVHLMQLGAAGSKVRAPEKTVRISGGSGGQNLLLETSEGKYFIRSGSLWNALASDTVQRAYAH